MQNTSKIYPHHEAWAVKNGYRKKVTSRKRQAASAKLKNIIESLLDRGPRISKREA